MKCPYCGHLDNKVIDSRLNKESTITRRRRSCLSCEQRFTTYERLEVMLPMLVKKMVVERYGIGRKWLSGWKKRVRNVP